MILIYGFLIYVACVILRSGGLTRAFVNELALKIMKQKS